MAFLTLSLSTSSLSYKLRLLTCVLSSVFAAAARTASLCLVVEVQSLSCSHGLFRKPSKLGCGLLTRSGR